MVLERLAFKVYERIALKVLESLCSGLHVRSVAIFSSICGAWASSRSPA